MTSEEARKIVDDFLVRHSTPHLRSRFRAAIDAEIDARVREALAEKDARIAELRGELGLLLDYFEKGVPWWYGTSPADRIRAALKGDDDGKAGRYALGRLFQGRSGD
jgi:hypothetical protein